MSAAELLDRLAQSGVTLWLEEDHLRFTAPKGALAPPLRAEIAAQRAAIVDLLRNAPLSSVQRQMWFLDQLGERNAAYNIAGAFRLRGAFDPLRFEGALQELAQRHDVLRTSFHQIAGEPLQRIAERVSLPLVVRRCTRAEEAERLVADFACAPFDLSQAPLLRALAIEHGPEQWILGLAVHHIVADEWSVGILLRELSAVYADPATALPALTLSYAQYARAQARALANDAAREACEERIAALGPPLPVLDLPIRGARPAVQDFSGARVGRVLPASVAAGVERLAREAGATPFMVLLAAFLAVLARHSGQDDLVVGTVTAGRGGRGLENLVGCFVNSLVLRADLSGQPSFRALLQRVRRLCLDAYSHADTPFEQLANRIAGPRDPSRSPLFQVAFVLENAPSGGLSLPGISVDAIETEIRASKFDLTLVVAERGGRLCAMIDYADALFDAPAMQRMLGHYERVLAAALRDPGRAVAAIDILDDAEHGALRAFENGPPAKIAGPVSLHGLFADQVRRTPDAVALRMDDAQWSYAELDARSDALAAALVRHGVRRGMPVGLCLTRSFGMVACILGVLKAGAAYLPLDPDYPAERLAYMVREADVRFIVTQPALESAGGLAEAASGAKILHLDALAEDRAEGSDTVPGQADDLACIVYTSGSTGAPKGVMLGHGGLCNLALAQIEAFAIDASSRVLQFASLSFDAAASEIFTALLAGAALVLAPRERLLTGLGPLLRDARISVVTLPPAMLKILPPEEFPDLKTLVVAGEACPPELARAWASGRLFLNAYGPAEASVCATIGAFAPGPGALPIGRPMAGVGVRILDSHLARVPAGVVGEIYISGVGVSAGYCRRPDLSAERFLPDPDGGATRLYATGDLGCWRGDGQIEYRGRRDGQIKLRGMRIEPGDVEAALCAEPGIAAAVVALESAGSEPQLIGYVVPRGAGAKTGDRALKARLRGSLPSYMIPARFVWLDALPLNANGKIDRKMLPAPQAEKGADGLVPPRDALELRLLRIWEAVLPGVALGVRDDFFDAGGQSLLAVKLLAAIEQQFGRAVSLTAMLTHPTIEALAVLLRRDAAPSRWSPLVELKPNRGAVPFFCVHPLGGNVAGYLPLARGLADGQGVFALQAPGLEAGAEPCARVEDLASLYVDAVAQAWPRGRLHLGGHSFGGLVAFEMVRQFRARGRAVDRLVLMDSPAPVAKNRPAPAASDGEWLRRRVGVLEAFHGADLGLGGDAFDGLPQDAQFALFLDAMRRAGLLPDDAGADLVARILAVQRASHAAAVAYLPEPMAFGDGAVTLLRATQRNYAPGRADEARAFSDEALDWRALVRGAVRVEPVPGDHISMLREPHVQAVAAALARAFA